MATESQHWLEGIDPEDIRDLECPAHVAAAVIDLQMRQAQAQAEGADQEFERIGEALDNIVTDSVARVLINKRGY